jgi:nucleotide-binding universal stress UspA family protein
MPDIALPEEPACTWETRYRAGDPIDEIEKAAATYEADVVIMPTTGRNGILDALRGSITERALRRLTCPLLAVPE